MSDDRLGLQLVWNVDFKLPLLQCQAVMAKPAARAVSLILGFPGPPGRGRRSGGPSPETVGR